jgi:hypothetical protein
MLAQHAEIAAEDAARVPAEGRREDDQVALVALNILDVLDEEADILVILSALALLDIGPAEVLVRLGTGFEALLNEIGLLAVEGHDANGGTFRLDRVQ